MLYGCAEEAVKEGVWDDPGGEEQARPRVAQQPDSKYCERYEDQECLRAKEERVGPVVTDVRAGVERPVRARRDRELVPGLSTHEGEQNRETAKPAGEVGEGTPPTNARSDERDGKHGEEAVRGADSDGVAERQAGKPEPHWRERRRQEQRCADRDECGRERLGDHVQARINVPGRVLPAFATFEQPHPHRKRREKCGGTESDGAPAGRVEARVRGRPNCQCVRGERQE